MESVIEQMKSFFEPKSIAVVGASTHIMKAGHIIFRNFVQNKRANIFSGELYAINPNEDFILGYRCYPSLSKTAAEEIELVVIVVPAEYVPSILRETHLKRTKAAIIISGGFSEIGNHLLEEEVKSIAKKEGIRTLGPNCLGVFDPHTGVDTLFLPETKTSITGKDMIATPRPKMGKMAVVTQSGAFGVASLDYLAGRRLGISKFVSFGNRIDIDETDLLQYFMADEKSDVILLYLEAIRKGERFMEIAGEVTKVKPIVVLKSGKTVAGAKAAISHTGSIAGSDQVYNAAFEQTGVIRAGDMEEFFGISKAFLFQPPTFGNNVAIVTDAGGPSIMASDECELRGLKIQDLSEESLCELEKMRDIGEIPKFASISNPIDLTGSVTSEMFEHTVRVVFDDSKINAVIFLGLHHVPGLQEDFVDRVASVSRRFLKPIVSCDIGETEMALYIRSRFEKLGIPSYSSPEDAAMAIAALYNYGLYLKKKNCFDTYLEKYRNKRSLVIDIEEESISRTDGLISRM